MNRSLSDIKFFTPKSLKDALAIRAMEKSGVRVIAGGTDVMVWQQVQSMPRPPAYLSIWGVRGLRGVSRLPNRLEIGALTTYSDLQQSEDVRTLYPALLEAARQVGAVQVQNRGTIGGNIVNASPAGDSLPVLAAANAILVLESQDRGSRRVPFEAFYTGYRRCVLADDELLIRIELPLPSERTWSGFEKVGSRRAQTISKVMAALQVRVDEDGRMSEVALAYGSVAPTVLRMPRVEAELRGKVPSEALADRVVPTLNREIVPIDDLRSTAEYRRFAAAGLLRRLLRRCQAAFPEWA